MWIKNNIKDWILNPLWLNIFGKSDQGCLAFCAQDKKIRRD